MNRKMNLIMELQKMVIAASVLLWRRYRKMVQTWPVGFYYLNHFQNDDELRYALQMIYSGIGACKAGSLTDFGFPHAGLCTLIENCCREIQKTSGFKEGLDDILNSFSPEKRHPADAEPVLQQVIEDNLNHWCTVVRGNFPGIATYPLTPELVKGDLLDQQVDVIVNAWNRNVIPWWLLLPQGVSGAIKRRGGYAPFREVGKAGIMPLGSAVLTGAGRLPFRGIIHVAGINLCWMATETSVRQSVRSAMEIVDREQFRSVAFPVIGSGSGNRSRQWALNLMLDEFKKMESSARVVIVEYARAKNDLVPSRKYLTDDESSPLYPWVADTVSGTVRKQIPGGNAGAGFSIFARRVDMDDCAAMNRAGEVMVYHYQPGNRSFIDIQRKFSSLQEFLEYAGAESREYKQRK